MNDASETAVKVRANSPGRYPILVVELSSGELRATYFETDYDLERGKTVEEDWLRDNAIGRHSFVGVEPPAEVPVSSLGDYARREIIG
ncbi:hypothetical protein GBA63_00130 [Rubrobacter tropicus]|uniref:Uncharacterized protein n=1 Tax=Rubrobacter tropicus TaxID=2653851 RepID=A0A6G8Q414_9ACTN|nr:hypothetical protein [Rubrobacter tropicus]QIN81198.1 hypothetical protein GBA63_00130 [Rubrobacter tropicus]